MARDQQCVRARRVRRHRRRTLREEARNRAHVRNSARTRSLCVSHEARGLGASLPHGRHEFAPRHATSNAPERVEFAGIAGAHLREEARNRGSEKPGARPNSARTRSLCVSHEPQGLGASLPHGRHEFAVRLSLALVAVAAGHSLGGYGTRGAFTPADSTAGPAGSPDLVASPSVLRRHSLAWQSPPRHSPRYTQAMFAGTVADEVSGGPATARPGSISLLTFSRFAFSSPESATTVHVPEESVSVQREWLPKHSLIAELEMESTQMNIARRSTSGKNILHAIHLTRANGSHTYSDQQTSSVSWGQGTMNQLFGVLEHRCEFRSRRVVHSNGRLHLAACRV